VIEYPDYSGVSSKLMRMAAAMHAKGLAKPMVWLQKQG
jgi:hypothetical protein